MPRNALIQLRGDTAANWTSANPVLAAREAGIETDTRKIKFGDGTTAWNSLGYLSAAAAASWGAITGTLSAQTDLQAALNAKQGPYTVASSAVSYTETATSGTKIVKITASGQTVTLPTAVGNTAMLTFKLMVAGTLTVDGAGTETIDGGLTATLSNQYEAMTLVSDNSNWQVI